MKVYLITYQFEDEDTKPQRILRCTKQKALNYFSQIFDIFANRDAIENYNMSGPYDWWFEAYSEKHECIICYRMYEMELTVI